MLKSGVWRLLPLLFLFHGVSSAQEDSNNPSPGVDTITPVPAPEIPFALDQSSATEMPKELNINNGGGTISGSIETGIRFDGPVHVKGDNGLEIISDHAILDLKTKTVTLEGDVSVYQGNLLQRGERAIYHYDTKQLESTGLRASLDPILLEAGKFTSSQEGGRQVFTGYDAGITTHDVEHPNYWIRSEKTRIYPGEKVVFNNMRVYAGDTPVFWLPYLSQPLDAELGYHFIPGTRTAWGPFLLNSYGIMLGGEKDPDTGENHDAWLLSRWRFDMRARRGLGVGLDLVDTRTENNNDLTGFSLYYANDLDPQFSRSGVVRNFIDPDRYSIQLKHRIPLDFPDDADWRIDSNLTYLSDNNYLEDFDEDRFRNDPSPDNTLGIYRRSDDSLLSLFTRFQLNDFYRADTRLPEVTLDLPRRPLFDLPIQHEGTFSLGLIGEGAADPTRTAIIEPLFGLTMTPFARGLLNQLSGFEKDLATRMVNLPVGDARRAKIRNQLLDASYGRFHSYNQFSMPLQLWNFLSFTPQAGVGYTRYGAVDGPATGMDRTHIHLGAETSLKFAKDITQYRNSSLGIDGLMHVFQPYTDWSVISTNDFEADDPGVDRLTPTTRPRPLDPIRFMATDQMDSWNVLRLGMRNRLITHRDNRAFEWLYLETFVDSFIDDPEGERTLSNLYNNARWQPVPWMGVVLETQFPIADSGSGFSEFGSQIRFMPNDHFEYSLGYRWLSGHPFLPDSSRIDFTSYYRMSENWGVSTFHSLELDDNTLEFQQYTMHRDLGNWVAGVGITSRDNRLREEFGVVFTLTLKDFPSASLPFAFDGR